MGPRCASMLLEWFKERAGGVATTNTAAIANPSTATSKQGLLWTSAAYQDDAAMIRSAGELAGAFEHLEYSVFRRYQNQLTRAERARLDNTIKNTLYKIERYAARLDGDERTRVERELGAIRDGIHESRERSETLRRQAKRADLKLAQLSTLTPEGFEEFVAEVFEALGYEVEQVGGTGDEGADLRLSRDGVRAVVQCKYHSRGVVGSPELQKFLGTIHHTKSHKGYFVTTRTFSLAAEKFVASHPIELVDGPRLVELVQDAIGPGAHREPEPAWF
ncbi:restriction endonuclease [Singulisphaera sp. PoT]|uniref:restriction endonuclease n=1 Tax=Singulisphaera sp. PoT TaxID=3411797 RepID=UPI003BF48E08